MPITKHFTLRSPALVSAKLYYFQDCAADSHLEYTIEAFHCDPKSISRLVAQIEDDLLLLN